MTTESVPVPLGEPAKAEQPVVFSQSETESLGFTNKLLRKTAYACGLLSFLGTGLSGISSQNHLRTAAGFGTAAVNGLSLVFKETNGPLPDGSLPSQVLSSLTKPKENTLFFNRSWSFFMNALTMASGIQSGRKKEMRRGAFSLATSGIEIAGLSRQDRLQKKYTHSPEQSKSAASKGKDDDDALKTAKTDVIHGILENRWVSLGSSAIRAGWQVSEGIEYKDKSQLAGGIFYCIAVASLMTDNLLIEMHLKKEKHAAAQR